MTEGTLKGLPRPLCRSTRVIAGLNPYQAVRAMAAALGSQAEVAAAAHIPAHLRGGTALTALRIQGFGPSVQARGALLDRLLADHGRVEALDDAGSDSFWESLRTVAPRGGHGPRWRWNVPRSEGHRVG